MTNRTIRSPIDWVGSQLLLTAHVVGSIGHALHHVGETLHSPAPSVRRITVADLGDALAKGFADLAAYRSDVFFHVVIYPVLSCLLARVAFGMDLLPLLFPLISGLTIVGPAAAVGLYEMSRRREQGLTVSWVNGLEVMHRPAIGAIAVLVLLLAALFLLWLACAWGLFQNTLGPVLPTSFDAFARDVFLTQAGQQMIAVGVGLGFLFAVLAMTISVVAFPLLVDRDAGLDTAVATSFRAVKTNLVPMAVWGMIVTAGLFVGALPLFLGLVVILPLLGHATWHLYRKLVPR
jgi:uncharacterized membrane protein